MSTSAASSNPILPGSGIVGVSTVVYPAGSQPQVVSRQTHTCRKLINLRTAIKTLGYWAMRGLAQAIRYVLAYAGVPFADVRYQQGGAPEFSRSAWLDVKERLQLDFPNLPYYAEPSSDLKLTQSTTILRHLGRRYNLIGKDAKEQAYCDLLFDTAYDFKSILVDTAYARQRSEAFSHFASKTIPHYFTQFESFRSKNQTEWIAGASLTIADFFLFEMLDQSELMVPGCLNNYPGLKKFHEKFLALPAISQYMKSAHYIVRPLNNMSGFQ